MIDANKLLRGTSNADPLTGGTGYDTLIGYDGNDSLWGGDGNDRLDGGAGNDSLSGGFGDDTLIGGMGDDILLVGSALDVIIENANEGIDEVRSYVSWRLGANLEKLTLMGTSAISGTGNGMANAITGNDSANGLVGGGGNDTLSGGGGNDRLSGGGGNDLLTGGNGADTFRILKGGGQDRFTDFNASQGDRIELIGSGVTSFDKLTISSSGSTHVIGIGDGTTFTLTSATAPQASWFRFDTISGGTDPGTGTGGSTPGTGTGGGTTDPGTGTGGGTGPTPASGSEGIFTWEGASLPSYWGGNFQTQSGLAAMSTIKATGANTITLVPSFFMANEYSTTMRLNPNESDTFAQVRQAIVDAKARGLNVVLKPHLETDNRVWRAEIKPSDVNAWFQNYKNMIVEYAKIAQEAGASMFCIGTEMRSMSGYEAKWEDIISAVRGVYSGKLTYAATDDEAKAVKFWDKLDYIGVDAYFPMTTSNSPTVQQLVDAWVKPSTSSYVSGIHNGLSTVDYYKSLSEQWGKKVIFAEVGYRSVDGANKDPGVFNSAGGVDTGEQRDAYEALFRVAKDYGGQWLDGAFIWSYQTSYNPSSSYDQKDYTPQGKPAEAVLKAAYSSPAHVAGRTITGTDAANKLDGGYNNDTIGGAGGNDTVWGGAGNDVLAGGAGADRFEFGSRSGQDRIQDFQVDQSGEVIAIARNANGQSLSTFEQVMARATTTGTDTVIDLGGGNSLTLSNVTKAQLAANDFMIV